MELYITHEPYTTRMIHAAEYMMQKEGSYENIMVLGVQELPVPMLNLIKEQGLHEMWIKLPVEYQVLMKL